MERVVAITMASLLLLLALSTSLPLPSNAGISSCNGLCTSLDDDEGQSGGTCQSSSNLDCNGVSYPLYPCSPSVTSSTPATLTNNDFTEGGSGGAPSECDNQYHSNSELIVALSTGWFANRSRCGQMIQITSTKTGQIVTANVVDECDSMDGCDYEHAGQPPCRNNIVDASSAVWNALGLDIGVGEENITWSMA